MASNGVSNESTKTRKRAKTARLLDCTMTILNQISDDFITRAFQDEDSCVGKFKK